MKHWRHRRWLYNRRSEVAAATVGADSYGYAYDSIGNRLWSAANAVTNSYTANGLNQYVAVCNDGETVEPVYDADGNLVSFADWSYAYDSAARLTEVRSNGVLVASNYYDHQGRRVRLVTSEASYTFIYGGWNVVLELVDHDGVSDRIEYYWGKDISGSLQGAGGVGGLLYLKRNGTIFVPIYDAFGNVMEYRAADGSLAASYVYDTFGLILAKSGPLADSFRFRHATKCFDAATGIYYYIKRFYSPVIRRWLNRDPIDERGGLNLYAFCRNNSLSFVDKDGQAYFAKRALSRSSWKKNLSQNSLLDPLNIEWSHEQLFFGTPDKPLDDFGYFDDGKVKSDPLRDWYNYVVTDSGYDDCVMRKAVAQVKPDPYLGVPIPWLVDNCQSYAEKLRRKYWELMKDKKVQCECFGKVL